MKLKRNSLKIKIWVYLIIFSILILVFLWGFQIIFLSSYYESSKTKELNATVTAIATNYINGSLYDNIDTLAHDSGICIQIVKDNYLIYDSSSFNKGCMLDNEFLLYKQSFILSNLNKESVKLINPKYNNDVLITAIRLDHNLIIFTSVSLQPLDSTINILKNQLITVSGVVLFLSFIIGYFISRKISIPIEKINSSAKELSKGNYTITFENKADIDEINELVETLNITTVELNKTENLRREFLANVSHDLKTPLTMIKAYAEMVRDLTYKNKKKREDNLNIIIEESDRLNTLVNDIVELSKIQANVCVLNYEDFNLVELVQMIIKRYDILIDKEHYEFIFNYDKEVIVNADKKRIEQVIYNLLNNAINYTGKDNKIIINIIEKEKVMVEISDTGKGIEQEDLNLIWDKYYKVDKNHKRDMVGSGVGLSIVKNILVNHNTNYGVKTIINKGTTFWFELPKTNDRDKQERTK